jgi:hypothetical protein
MDGQEPGTEGEKQMNRWIVGIFAMVLGTLPMAAQSIEDLNIQIHGYATQGFVYSTQNNWNSMTSSNGSPAWTEAVVNVTTQPEPKLRVGVQARYFLLGNYGNAIALDWADADYKVNEKFGVRFGKVKTPEGMFNMIQDIDPAYIWSILPQGIYEVATRTSILSHYGGVVYGTLRLPSKAGSMDYRVWDGERIIASNDPLLLPFAANGILFPSGQSCNMYGGTLQWHTPVQGLMLGVSESQNHQGGTATLGPFTGNGTVKPFQIPFYYGQYERSKFTAIGEYMRLPPNYTFTFTNGPTIPVVLDIRNWYLMSTYKLTEKLTGGVYYASSFNLQAPLGPARYQKDWTLSARYDVSQYIYLKAEQHFVDGMQIGFSPVGNSTLNPQSKLTILKVGVSF